MSKTNISDILRNLTLFENECFISNIKLYKKRIRLSFDLDNGTINDSSIISDSDANNYIHSSIIHNNLIVYTNCYFLLYNLLFDCFVTGQDLKTNLQHLHFKCRMNNILVEDIE